MDRKESNKKIAASVIKDFLDKLNLSYIDEVKYALEILEVTLDERLSVVGKLNTAVENAHKILRKNKDYLAQENLEQDIEIEKFFQKVDSFLFSDSSQNCTSITLNPQDYQKYFMKQAPAWLYKRYEPATHTDLIKVGIMGYLKNDKFTTKQIKISREVEIGKIVVNQTF